MLFRSGSNFGGIAFRFIGENLKGNKDTRIIGVEPASCPTLTKGRYVYDFGDTAGSTPMMKMYTLGHSFVPSGIHAGGLRYHGDSPIISKLVHEGRMEAVAHPQRAVFEANVLFAKVEGKLPAPEAGHAIASVIQEAAEATRLGDDRVILFNYCGHGLLDLSAYEDFLAGRLTDEA